MYCSFSHFRVGFIFQIRMLPLDHYMFVSKKERQVEVIFCGNQHYTSAFDSV